MSGGKFLVKDVNVSIFGIEIRCGCAEGGSEGCLFNVARFA